MNTNLDDKTQQDLVNRISRIEGGERPEEMETGDWLMPIGACVLITVLLLLSL